MDPVVSSVVLCVYLYRYGFIMDYQQSINLAVGFCLDDVDFSFRRFFLNESCFRKKILSFLLSYDIFHLNSHLNKNIVCFLFN